MAPVERLKRRADFVRVGKKGRRQRRNAFNVQHLPRATERDGGPLVGFTVTRQTGNACVRSRIKRRLRAAVDRAAGALSDRPVDIVIFAQRGALDAAFDILVADMHSAFRRVSGSTT